LSHARLTLALLVGLAVFASGAGSAQEMGPVPPPPLPADIAPRAPAPAAAPAAPSPDAVQPAPVAAGNMIRSIRVEGNQRIEAGTIESYMLLRPGDAFDTERMDRSLKTLYATGLFADVSVERQGDVLVVHVKENPIVNRVAFEGNSELTDEALTKEIQLRPRAVYTAQQAEADRQKLLDAYAAKGYFAATVAPKVIHLADNRVDVVYDIKEGPETLISRISFVGNKAFTQSALRSVVDSRQTVWWNFLTSSDTYSPERLKYDRELLRKFYMTNGYADFTVISANGELSPDRRSFFLTFVIHEGERYKVGKLSVVSQYPRIDPASVMKDVKLKSGNFYNGEAVDLSVQAISKDVQARGEPFVVVHPNITRHPKEHIIDIVFNVDQGPRVYVERIDIVGNTRTEDDVIRREFKFAEGDPLNQDEIKSTQQALKDLGYFNTATVTTSPGSSPDREIVTATVDEKSTGNISLGGGYSTDFGALLNIGVSENNLGGTGINAGINGMLAQFESTMDLNVSDPYFLGRNLFASVDINYTNLQNYYIADYSEQTVGITPTIGYNFNDHYRQSWTYTAADRQLYGVTPQASYYILSQQAVSTLSQIGQVFTIDYRDSQAAPHAGFVIRAGTDAAGLGGSADFIRAKLDGQLLIPLDYFTGNNEWGLNFVAGTGYLYNEGAPSYILDRFYLGGQNLRGFLDGGVGPHDPNTGDSLGGDFIWTQSSELDFPLPVPASLGISGRTFADIGNLQGLTQVPGHQISRNDGFIRLGAGVGITWNSPFGLINIDVADPLVKSRYDQTEIFRVGFGTRF